ncbi:MAG: monovalent cation/H(+) antiporter subunit G [Deltaproteobacteria bacterium]|nr:MAG: monovalent cation/H(+) antiporter subunit G [Deltaproteobacteria bacterium]
MSAADIVAVVLLSAGLFFFLVATVGVLRFPDLFTRLHPAGKGDTLGASLLILGLCVHEGLTLVTVKLLLVECFILLSNPVAAHALGRAALRDGVEPWEAEAAGSVGRVATTDSEGER